MTKSLAEFSHFASSPGKRQWYYPRLSWCQGDRVIRKLIERKRGELEQHGVCGAVPQTSGALSGRLRLDTEFAVPRNKFTRVLAG